MTTGSPRKERFKSRRFSQIFGSAALGDTAAAIAAVAIPLLVVGPLQGDPFLVGIAVATDDIGWLIIGPVAGVLIDRYGFKRLLIGSEIVRFAAFGTIAALVLGGVLSPLAIIILLIIKSVSSVFFLVGSPSLLSQAIDSRDLVQANSALTFSQSISIIIGPPLAGLLASLFSVNAAFIVASVCYLISAIFLSTSLRGYHWKLEEQMERPKTKFWHELVEGWKYLGSRTDVLRMVMAGAHSNFSLAMQQAVLVIYLLSLPGFTTLTVGVALGAAGFGGVVASMSAGKISGRFGDARTVFWVVLGGMALGLLVPFTQSIPTVGFLALGYFGLTVATVVFSAITGAYRQRTIPANILARVTASSRFISWGIAPFGALLGGALATVWGPWLPLLISSLLFVGTPFWLVGITWITIPERNPDDEKASAL
ncbi:MFS transporter [Arthrobacter sp. NPDC055585]